MTAPVPFDLDPAATNREVAALMSRAALAWIGSLTDEQKSAACWPSPGLDAESDAERVRWFYTPTDHGGLTMAQQRPRQHRRVMQLLRTGLSTAGYVTVSMVMGWENVLDLVEDYTADWARERGRDPGMYYVRVFGDPAADRIWGWRFGGHHVSINFLIAHGEVISTTPFFLGADPAAAPGLGGAVIRPLSQAEDLARTLVTSLDPGLLRQAIIWPAAPTDIVGANRPRIADGDRMITLPGVWRGRFTDPALANKLDAISAAAEALAGVSDEGHEALALTEAPQGVPGAALDDRQSGVLGALVGTYTGRVTKGLVPEHDLNQIHFAWAGSTAAGEPHYYRLHGPGFLAEWDNTQRSANHAHSVWRDPDTDFGHDSLAAHRAEHHS